MDDFLPFVIYMVEWSTKNCVFCWYTTAEKQKTYFFSIIEPFRFFWSRDFQSRAAFILYIVPLPPNLIPMLNQNSKRVKMFLDVLPNTGGPQIVLFLCPQGTVENRNKQGTLLSETVLGGTSGTFEKRDWWISNSGWFFLGSKIRSIRDPYIKLV